MRDVNVVVREIKRVWTKPFYGAVPYLNALSTVTKTSDHYGMESAHDLINYLLSNLSTFRGPDARRLKIELKELLNQKGLTCVICNHSRPDVVIRVNPYKSDIYGITKPEALCDECTEELSADV